MEEQRVRLIGMAGEHKRLRQLDRQPTPGIDIPFLERVIIEPSQPCGGFIGMGFSPAYTSARKRPVAHDLKTAVPRSWTKRLDKAIKIFRADARVRRPTPLQ